LKVARFDEGRLGLFRNGLVKNQLADITHQTCDKKPFAIFQTARLGDLFGKQGAQHAFAPERGSRFPAT
jgi:hypothetical protein